MSMLELISLFLYRQPVADRRIPRGRKTMNQKVLEMKGISKSFGNTHALSDLDFELELGEVHALLGENGAGKSTLIKVLGGIHHPDTGEIRINGSVVRMQNVQAAQQEGIGIIHQEIVLVPYLTVTDNLFLGRELINRFGLKDIGEMNRQATEMVKAIGLDIDVTTPVVELSIAQQQMVEIAKAISFHVKILVMDEPTSSLSDDEVEKLFATIVKLKENQVSIIYISHRMEELFRISDRVTVIRDGQYVGTRITKETNVDELVAMMVGRSLQKYYTRTYHMTDKEVLRVEHLTKKGLFEDVNFSVHEGEILGFSGLVGAGRSEIMTAIFGGYGYDSGNVILSGETVHVKNCNQAIARGIAMVPEDRKKQGLVLSNSVGYNITLASLKYLMSGFMISNGKRQKQINQYMKDLNVKAASESVSVSSLSGGNQQKVVLAKWLATRPKLLILDEPTRGVDVGAKSEIYAIINKLAEEGMAIIMISSELPEIINMCDNVCVVRNGKIVGTLRGDELDQENIMKLATGGEVTGGAELS